MTLPRILRFQVVAVLGAAVQLGVLSAVVHAGGLLFATFMAVAAAVAHNFVWHRCWTWADRATDASRWTTRFWRFTLSTGAVSIAGNVLITGGLVGLAGASPVGANVLAIVSCGLVNFWLGDRFVFQKIDALHARESRRGR